MRKVVTAAISIAMLPPVPSRCYGIKLMTSPSNDNQNSKLYGNLVRPTASGTLRKEFEKDKLGNIRLRAVPVPK